MAEGADQAADAGAATPQQGSPQGQPPFGSSPATGPTQNRGNQVAALKMAGFALKALEMIVPLAGSSSPLGKAVLDTIKKLGPLVPPGAITPQDEQNIQQQMMLRRQQFGQNVAAMRARAAQPGAGAPAQPGAASPGAAAA